MTHPDPVRPVAPRDYVWLLNEAKSRVRRSVLWKRFIDGTPLENDIAVWMADLASEAVDLAAAPVPADPQDYRCSEHEILEAMHRFGGGFVRQLAMLYRLGDPHNRRILETAYRHYFLQYDQMALRATGEGARDATEVKTEMPDVSDAVDHRHRAIRRDDPVLPEVSEGREVAADRLAAPVAVALDPHRLMLNSYGRRCFDAGYEAALARLRGEAAVRPSD